MHLNDGQLRASLDGELGGQPAAHLRSCAACQQRQAEIAGRSEQARRSLAALSAPAQAAGSPVVVGRARP